MVAYFKSALGWRDLFKRTWQEFQADNGMGLAAQLAYYFFLALFPALLFLIALASFLPAHDLVGRVVAMLNGVAPPEVIKIISDQLLKIAEGDQGGLLSFGVIAALWSSSAAMVAIIDALNRAYDVDEGRPWWKGRLTAILLTVGVATFMLVSFALIVAGPELADWVASQVGLGSAFALTWKIVQWPLVFVLVATAIGLIYYFAPDVDQDFAWITPGSLVATVLWLLGSLAFRIYVVNFASYNETYGTIGGVMVLMLWLYLTGVSIIMGAEMNAEIEHASPHGKAAGEKVPGERKSIGARAAREFEDRQHQQPRPATSVQGPAPRAAFGASPVMTFARVGTLVGGAVAMVLGRRV
jgi:membrane protein